MSDVIAYLALLAIQNGTSLAELGMVGMAWLCSTAALILGVREFSQ